MRRRISTCATARTTRRRYGRPILGLPNPALRPGEPVTGRGDGGREPAKTATSRTCVAKCRSSTGCGIEKTPTCMCWSPTRAPPAGDASTSWSSEVVGAATWYAFEFLKAKRVEICCDPDNERSPKIPERLGYTFEGNLKFSEPKEDGSGVRDTLVFARYDLEGLPEFGFSLTPRSA